MKNWKKGILLLLVICLVAGLSVSACTRKVTDSIGSNTGRVPIVAAAPVDLPPVSLYDAYHIPGTQHTGSAYSDSFTCDPEDRNRLNIFVRNDGASAVIVNVTWEDKGMVKEFPAYEIAAGKNKTQTYLYEDGAGLNGRWTVEVTTRSGHPLNIWVSARQYQINP